MIRPWTPAAHERDRRTAHIEGGCHVQIEMAAPFGVRNPINSRAFGPLTGLDHPGIVYENIEPAEAFNDRLDQLGSGVGIGQISGKTRLVLRQKRFATLKNAPSRR